MVRYTAVSSVNRRGCTLSGRSLIYSRNKIGPRTEPCGTPEDTGTSSEHSPSRRTLWLLPTKKDWIHWSVLPCVPCICSLYRSFRRLTLSKALLKSSRIRSVCLLSMRDLARSSTSSINCVSQDLRSRKSCCKSYSMLYLLKCLIKLDAIMYSMDLHRIHVREIGR